MLQLGPTAINSQLRGYQSTILNRFGEGRDFAGKHILEIGGERQTAAWLLGRGAAGVWLCDPTLQLPSNIVREDKITLTNSVAQDVWKLTDQRFDFVFGIAVLEHFRSLHSHLEDLRRVMKRSATLYLHGGPIWTCSKGHHIWVKGTRQYLVNDFDPILPWEHLYATPECMAARLARDGIPEADIPVIVNFTYKDNRLSRLGYNDLRSIFLNDEHFYQRQWMEVHNGPRPDKSLLLKLESCVGKQPFTVRAVIMDLIAR